MYLLRVLLLTVMISSIPLVLDQKVNAATDKVSFERWTVTWGGWTANYLPANPQLQSGGLFGSTTRLLCATYTPYWDSATGNFICPGGFTNSSAGYDLRSMYSGNYEVKEMEYISYWGVDSQYVPQWRYGEQGKTEMKRQAFKGTKITIIPNVDPYSYPVDGLAGDGYWYVKIVNQTPVISVSDHQSITVSQINSFNTVTLRGKVYDPDGDSVTVSAKIAGIQKTISVAAPTSNPTADNWTLTWVLPADNIPEGTYSNVVITADDGKN